MEFYLFILYQNKKLDQLDLHTIDIMHIKMIIIIII